MASRLAIIHQYTIIPNTEVYPPCWYYRAGKTAHKVGRLDRRHRSAGWPRQGTTGNRGAFRHARSSPGARGRASPRSGCYLRMYSAPCRGFGKNCELLTDRGKTDSTTNSTVPKYSRPRPRRDCCFRRLKNRSGRSIHPGAIFLRGSAINELASGTGARLRFFLPQRAPRTQSSQY